MIFEKMWQKRINKEFKMPKSSKDLLNTKKRNKELIYKNGSIKVKRIFK